jgi:2-keto-4-pentenoate hydratase/2-oxohepta-3-ene-1,7-dioic acid hydratase in catechol pathway
VTKNEVIGPQNRSLWLDVNGLRYQCGSTKTMVCGVAYPVHYPSQFISLPPDGIIYLAPPPRVWVGPKTQLYLREGQVIELDDQ